MRLSRDRKAHFPAIQVGIAAQLSLMKLAPLRELMRWIARAISSLPVPVSPRMRTQASLGATVLACVNTCFNAGLSTHDFFKVQFGADFILQVEFLFLQLVGKFRNFMVG